MADTKISAEAAASALSGSELVEGVQSAANVKITIDQIKTYTSASPTLVTPALGAATGTSFNGLTVTSTTGTVTLTNAKTLAVTNSLTLAGTDSTTMTFPPASASIGYLDVPQRSATAGDTAALTDRGKHILMTTAGTYTIPANGSIAFPVGSVLTYINGTTSCTIPITSDTMTLAGSATTGTRTLAANGIAVAIKTGTATWIISGTGLT